MSSSKIGRSAIDGKFTTVKEAKQQPRTHVIETIKHPSPPKPAAKPKGK